MMTHWGKIPLQEMTRAELIEALESAERARRAAFDKLNAYRMDELEHAGFDDVSERQAMRVLGWALLALALIGGATAMGALL